MSKVPQKKVDVKESMTSSSGGESSEQLADSSLAQLKQDNHAEMFGGSDSSGVLQAKVHQLQGGDEKLDVASYQKEIYSTLGGIDLSGAKGYEEKKTLLENAVRDKMKAKGATTNEVNETLALPLIDHRISILSRGSKAMKLAEGIEVQHIQSEKFNAFLDNIGAKTGSEVHAAPLKNYARMKTKEEDKYEGDIGRIKDVIRASFLFHKVEEIAKAQDTIASMSSHSVLEVKNRFDVSEEQLSENLNYRDIIFIVETDKITGSPVKIELQLHLEALHAAKTKIKASFPNGAHHAHVMKIAGSLGLSKSKIAKNQYTGHDFYKVIRELTKSEDPFEQEIVDAAKTQSRKIYGGAWDDYKSEEKK